MADAGGKQSPGLPDGNTSRWTFNWRGLIGLAIIVSIAGVTWRSLEGSPDDPSEQLSVIGTSASTDSPDTTTTRTTPSTTVPPAPPTTRRSTTTTVEPERQVLISGDMKPCRYGDSCLIASFTISGFDEHPARFICIYPNSQREFTFSNDGVDEACLTADAGDTITIEIGGIRSATISEQDLDGT